MPKGGVWAVKTKSLEWLCNLIWEIISNTYRQLSRFVFSSWIYISDDSLEENLFSYKASLQLSSQITSSNSSPYILLGSGWMEIAKKAA